MDSYLRAVFRSLGRARPLPGKEAKKGVMALGVGVRTNIRGRENGTRQRKK